MLASQRNSSEDVNLFKWTKRNYLKRRFELKHWGRKFSGRYLNSLLCCFLMVLYLTTSEECFVCFNHLFWILKETQFEGRRFKRHWQSSSPSLHEENYLFDERCLWSTLIWQVNSLRFTMQCVIIGLDVISSCTYTPCCYPMLATTIHSKTFQTITFHWKKRLFYWGVFQGWTVLWKSAFWLVRYIRVLLFWRK